VEIELARSRSGGTRGAGWPEKSKAGLNPRSFPQTGKDWGNQYPKPLETAGPRAHPPPETIDLRKRLRHPHVKITPYDQNRGAPLTEPESPTS